MCKTQNSHCSHLRAVRLKEKTESGYEVTVVGAFAERPNRWCAGRGGGACARERRREALAKPSELVTRDPLTATRRPRPARARTAPCPAVAPDDLPLAPAH
eukprot:2390124-Prymnesium_polylepis.1